jgi:hypothetical protein
VRRRLFNLAAAVSLVLCVATFGAWVSSENRNTWFGIVWGRSAWWLISSGGELAIWTVTIAPENSVHHWSVDGGAWGGPGTSYGGSIGDAIIAEEGLTESHLFGGVRWGAARRQAINMLRVGRIRLVPTPNDEVGPIGDTYCGVPHWMPTLLLASTSLLAYRKARRRRSMGLSSLCPTCGYDLRATPGRCPECGTIPPAAPPCRRRRVRRAGEHRTSDIEC